MSLNKVMLIGNVGKEPVVRHLENGTAVTTFSLATSERYKDRTGVLREITEWHSIVCWRALSDFCEKYIRKGSSIYVEGRLSTRSWDDRDGQKHYVTEIVANDIRFVGRRTSDGTPGQNADGRAAGIEEVPPADTDTIDDLPF